PAWRLVYRSAAMRRRVGGRVVWTDHRSRAQTRTARVDRHSANRQSTRYDFGVHIHASAPTRIDLAGGTLDIWPLYLFHDGAQTLNAAISLRASCDLRTRVDRRLVIVSEDSQERVEVDHWSQLRDTHDLRLLGRLLHYFQAEGLGRQTRSDSPVGAGLPRPPARNIAVRG